MFGYVMPAPDGLPKERQDRYRAFYCGVCHSLKDRYGLTGRVTLSYDLTLLAVLLTSLYEPEETAKTARCVPHPLHPHTYLTGEIIDYCADMNLILAYHKAADDKADENGLRGRAEEALLRGAYGKARARYPEVCASVEKTMGEIRETEKQEDSPLDLCLNLSAKLLGAVFAFRQDYWRGTLTEIGEGLGRFVYLMDAYDDLDEDMRRGRFNPLKKASLEPDYEDFVKQSLTLLLAEAAQAFETLPLEQDVDLLRNVFYAGCWNRYEQLRAKRDKTLPARTGGKS